MTDSAVKIETAATGGRIVNACHNQAMGGLMVRGLRPLLGPNVATACHDRRSRKLQRQECEH